MREQLFTTASSKMMSPKRRPITVNQSRGKWFASIPA
jgi:hypothetical protein